LTEILHRELVDKGDLDSVALVADDLLHGVDRRYAQYLRMAAVGAFDGTSPGDTA
jgi:hypothetical protein